MEKGKFSQPRPYRDEERQIEEAFRQVTEQKNAPRYPRPIRKEPAPEIPEPVSDETASLPESLLQDYPYVPLEPAQMPAEEPPIEDLISQKIQETYPEEIPAEPEEDYPEDDYEESNGFLDKLIDFCAGNKKGVLMCVCAAALVPLIAIVAIFASAGTGTQQAGRIPGNVIIAGVNVGGMTEKEAISAVKQATSHTYTVEDMVVEIGDTTLRLSPKDTGASLDVKAAVAAAMASGNAGNQTIALLPYLQLDTDYILDQLKRHADGTMGTLTQVSYGLEGNYPSLDPRNFDPSSAQTLVLTMGTPGVTFDTDRVYDQILDAYSLHIFHVAAEDVQPTVEPDPVDLQAIYDEFYVAPKDSTLDRQTFEVIPGSYGYEFDLEKARKQLEKAGYGDVLRIPMQFLEPELLDETFLFRDVLGEAQTAVRGTNNQISNIRLACEAMDGTILQPGETFSYNNCLGEPTESKGYKPAPACSGTELTDITGGGICQGATTLYSCALLSDLEIVSRSNHGFPVSYIDYGLDATVSWGGPDFKFRNNTSYPIQIRASVSDSYLSIQILGTDERDYFVKMDYNITNVHEPATEYQQLPHDNPEGYRDGDVIQEAVTGYSVKTYKLKYSRSTGKLISKDYEASSRYLTQNRIVAQVLPPETTVPETTVPETTAPWIPAPTEPEPTIPETTVPEVPDSQWDISENITQEETEIPAAA